jgi:hypothetical protein
MYMRPPVEAEDVDEEVIPIKLTGPIAVTLGLAAIVTIILGVWPTPLVNLTSLGIFG